MHNSNNRMDVQSSQHGDTEGARDVYKELGVTRIINTSGNATILGGCQLSPTVLQAYAEANDYWADMSELMAAGGKIIADLLGAEAATFTGGAYSALMLSCAGIMTGKDPQKIGRLPDTSGMKNEFVFQKTERYDYWFGRSVSSVGGKLIEVKGEEAEVATAARMEAAIDPQTAGILWLGSSEYYLSASATPHDTLLVTARGKPPAWGSSRQHVSLSTVVDIAKRKGVPVLVDAAGNWYPERMRSMVKSGADLLCFGAKYFGSVQSCGFLVGRRELVEAAADNDFLAFHYKANRSVGRGMKLDRAEIVSTVVAFREWMNMDMQAYLRMQEQRIGVIVNALADLPDVKTSIERYSNYPNVGLKVTVDVDSLGKSSDDIMVELKADDPSIIMYFPGKSEARDPSIMNTASIMTAYMREEDVAVVARRLREVLSR